MGQLVQACLPSMQKGISDVIPGLECAGFKLHPFSVEVSSLSNGVSEDFWKFLHDSTARDAFEALPLTQFLSMMSEPYPYVADVPIRALLMFPSNYLCKQGFSAMFYI